MLEQVAITKHALERYAERLMRIGGDRPDDLALSLEALLHKATLEEMDEITRVIRAINNNFNPAEYFTYDGWRFVVANNALVTVERTNKDEN